MYRISLVIVAFLAILFLSCEKNIHIENRPADPVVVIEGIVEVGEYPVVIVSRSMGIFTSIRPEEVSEYFIKDAEVEVSRGNQTMRLKTFSSVTPYGLEYTWYTADTTQPGPFFKGEAGKAYQLKVVADGKEFTATTTIPERGIDILGASAEPANLEDYHEKMRLMVTITDKPGYGNYHRYFTKVNDEPFYPGLYSSGSDQLTDGVTVTFRLDRGVDKSSDFDPDLYAYYDKGDSVVIKFSEIDYDTYEFWRTVEFNYASIGNPFSTPIKVKGNIKGGALGYFGGYNPLYYSLRIPQ